MGIPNHIRDWRTIDMREQDAARKLAEDNHKKWEDDWYARTRAGIIIEGEIIEDGKA